jgi:hypothetical protein
MSTHYQRSGSSHEAQFGLLSLLGFVTVCAVLSALSGVVGPAASVLLMLMALALWARQGVLALAMLMAACIAANANLQPQDEGASIVRQLAIIATATGLGIWYCLRRRLVR